MKKTLLLKRAIAIGIVGAMVLCETVPSFAAPVPSSAAIVKTTAPNMLDQVRSRRGRAIGAGVALGVIGALAGAAAAQNQGYYGPAIMAAPAITALVVMAPATMAPATMAVLAITTASTAMTPGRR